MHGDEPPHNPVLVAEVLQALEPHSGGRYIDATVGAGGHAEKILDASSPDGILLGLDGDLTAIRIARARLEKYGSRAILLQTNFNQLQTVAESRGFNSADGVLLDLGLSSMQLNDPGRGFSFASDSLDMRMDVREAGTAWDLVNNLQEDELADLIYRYGEEPFSRKIARRIVQARPIESAQTLAEVVARAVGRRGKTHAATKTFQALRISVNRELVNLEIVLRQLKTVVAGGGRVAIITFHSLEDRIVKNYFKSNPDWLNLTKHPARPTPEERRRNPRSRSAKLRVAQRVG